MKYMNTFEFLLDIALNDLAMINRGSCLSDLIEKHCKPREAIENLLNIITAENPLI